MPNNLSRKAVAFGIILTVRNGNASDLIAPRREPPRRGRQDRSAVANFEFRAVKLNKFPIDKTSRLMTLCYIEKDGCGTCDIVTKCLAAFAMFFLSLSCFADGYRPDPVEYQKALRGVVEFRCRDFKRFGVSIDPEVLQYGQEEIIDSFLNGRANYRTWRNRYAPVSEKLGWLKEILGSDYDDLHKAWIKAIEDHKAGRGLPWTPERIRQRLDELAAMPESPVRMDAGMCRSSTAGCVARTDYRCLHCGRHTVYTDIDAVYHRQSPEYFKRIADEIKEWGLDVEVDGREACPDCCTEQRDFKLSTTAVTCRSKACDDSSGRRSLYPPVLPAGIDMNVIGLVKFHGRDPHVYVVKCVLPTAWGCQQDGQFVVYAATNGLHSIASLRDDTGVKYAEPRETCRGPYSARVSKIVDFPCDRVKVDADRVEVMERCRSSELFDIPPTSFVVNGRRFVVDEFTAQALRAFVQGYTTFVCGSFSDNCTIQRALPRLRECLLGE